ncbi:MAG: hypothetical protein LH481_13760, partial [Burkholderiales bacterium]|nr:hypothetical protein [Burkholderiales bacterium]
VRLDAALINRRTPRFMLHCCNNVIFHIAVCRKPILLHHDPMHRNVPRLLNDLRRPLRARMLALLLLVAQISSLLIVPLHAIAHGQAVTSGEATVAGSGVGNPFSSLFGHEQGLTCDDWTAAFALDSHSGHCAPGLPAVLTTTTRVVCSFQTESPATPFRPFLARAPPRL